jgi:hypothetical protein
MGVYATSEFKDDFGDVYKIDLHDTTYTSGGTHPCPVLEDGVRFQIDGWGDAPEWLGPLYTSNIVVPLHVDGTNTAITSIIPDFRIAKENQYFILLYKNSTLFWMGKVQTDQIQYEDLYNHPLEINATDGLNRLEGFRCTSIAAVNAYDQTNITLLEALNLLLDPCEFEQFFLTTDPYIRCCMKWSETYQTATNGFLKNTSLPKSFFIEDAEKFTYKTNKQALEDLLMAFGLSIRMDNGCWMVFQPEALDATTMVTYNYSRTNAYLSQTTYTNTVTISGSNYPLNVLVNNYAPNYKEVAIKRIDDSECVIGPTDYGIDVTGPSKSIDITLGVVYKLNYWIKSFGTRGAEYMFTFRMICGQYELRRWQGNLYWRNRNSLLGTDPVRVDFKSSGRAKKDSNGNNQWDKTWTTPINIDGNITIPALPSDCTSTSLWFNEWVSSTNGGLPYANTSRFAFSLDEPYEVQYSTTNNDANAASVTVDRTAVVADSANSFSSGALRIYTGSTWQYSQTWTDGTLTGQKLLELLSKKTMYYHRSPRLVVSGGFTITGFGLSKRLSWRSSNYLLLQGTWIVKKGVWSGSWMELLSQTSDVATVSSNPYRNPAEVMNKDLINLLDRLTNMGNQLNELTQTVGNHNTLINQMQRHVTAGPEKWLLQNVAGIPNGASDDATYTLKALVSNDGNKTLKLIFQ